MGVSRKRNRYALGYGREDIGLVSQQDHRRIIGDALERSFEIIDAELASRPTKPAPGESLLIAESSEPEFFPAFCKLNALVFQHRNARLFKRDFCRDRAVSAR